MAEPKDAVALLKADHRIVEDLFASFEKASGDGRKQKIAEEICKELTIHTKLEEEIFYPAVKLALKDKELIPEATVEHSTLKDLIAQVEGIEPDGEMFDAKIKVMSEYVKHHVKEEQNEIFSKAKTTDIDFVKLGSQMATRKAELLAARG